MAPHVRVVMPFAIPYGEAIKALLHWAPDAEVISVAYNDYAYWELFCRLWRDGQPFIIVEHDIVIRKDTIRSLADCEASWCAYVYHQAPGNPVSGLGCTKFVPSGALHYTPPEPVWQNVDSVVTGAMRKLGWEVHEHGSWLRHLNPRVAAQQESRNTR